MNRDIEGIDEVLQIMYWLSGEGLLADVSAADLERFLPWPPERLGRILEDMAALGLVEHQGFTAAAPRFILSIEGRKEGARRFAEEFSTMVRPGHGECGDADCDCHSGEGHGCRS